MKKPIPFGKYLLLERINVGGMAEVFMAKAQADAGLERLFAIKKILPTMVEDEEFITMFLDEARISVQLNHANIVQIHDLGRQDDNFYIAMDYVAGKDLRTILERYRRRNELMPTAQVAYLVIQMCHGLDYAHRKKDARGMDLNIVHRDVSPQNILVSYAGDVKLIDFGIAKAANRAQKTQAGILKGKFGYMSPEQVRGLPIDRRSDIFALGVVMFEMLTGEKLFVGESDFSTLEKVRNAEVPSPREFNQDIPAELEKILYKALAREVEDRYQWPSELAADLEAVLGDAYDLKMLGEFMAEAFRDDQQRERQRLEQFAAAVGASRAPEPAPVEPGRSPGRMTSASLPAARSATGAQPRHSVAAMPAAPRNSVASMPAAPRNSMGSMPAAPRRNTAQALASDPVAAAMAELSQPEPRPSARVVTPPRNNPAPARLESTTLPQGDPNNPYIPPPSAEELAEMNVSADRTIMARPEDFLGELAGDSGPQKQPSAAALGLETMIQPSEGFAPAERETLLDESGSSAALPPSRRSRLDLRAAPIAPAAADDSETRAGPVSREPEPTRDAPDAYNEEQGDTYDGDPPPRDATEQALEPYDDEPAEEGAEPENAEDGFYDEQEPEPVRPAKPRRTSAKAPAVTGSSSTGRPRATLVVGFSALSVVVLAALGYLVVTLLAPQASITIHVDPSSSDAQAVVDGKRVPLDTAYPVASGKHTIALRMPGQPEQSKEIEVKGPKEIQFQIQPAEPTKAAEPAPTKAPEPEKAPAPVAEKASPPPAPEKAAQPSAPVAEKPQAPAPEKAAPAPEKAAAPAPEKSASKGGRFNLLVVSDPDGATVTVGKLRGTAPYTAADLDRGKNYNVEVKLKGYKTRTVSHVKFTDQGDPQVLNVALEKEPERSAAPRHEASRAEPAPAAGKGKAILICSSTPTAEVFVDGKTTHRWTPVPMNSPINISSGHHTITFKDASGHKAVREVTAAPDDTVRLVGVDLSE